MATVEYDFFGLVGGIAAGGVVGATWSHVGFDYGDAITITAHPIRGILEVRNLRVFRDGNERRVAFEIVNVGSQAEIGFGIGFGWIDR